VDVATFAAVAVVVLNFQVFLYGDVSLSVSLGVCFPKFRSVLVPLPSESSCEYLELVVGLLDPEGEGTAILQELHIQRH
jgi:hypothetical protein